MSTEPQMTTTENATRTELQLIGGERVPAADGRTIDVLDPATGAVIATVPRGGTADVEAAVDAAEAAFPAWRDTSATERGAVIARWAQLVREHEAELDALEGREVGRPHWGPPP